MGMDAPALEKQTQERKNMKNILLSALGFLLVIGGMALILAQWDILVLVVKACAGPVLAVAGLVILFAVSSKKQ